MDPPDRIAPGRSSDYAMDMPARASEWDAEQPVIEAIQEGDRFAFTELVHRHDRWVRGVVYGVLGDARLVDDVAQQIWLAVWQRIVELRDSSRWRAWLYRLARNAAVDAVREASRTRLRRVSPDNEVHEFVLATQPGDDPAGRPDQTVVQKEEHGRVAAAIAKLPAIYREPLVLRHLQGWSYREIADVMSIPVDTVETRLVRARRRLRDSLKNILEKT